MMSTPMLTKEADSPPIVPTAEATLISPAAVNEAIEPKATSLRRAATALFFFGVICARPCPCSWGAWLAIAAAFSVLCASRKTLLCRARVARALSFFAAIFAIYIAVKNTTSFRAGTPLQMSVKVHEQCTDMPPETFKYVVEHKAVREGLSFLSRHMAHDSISTAGTHFEHSENTTKLVSAGEPEWTQPEACDPVARFVARATKFVIVGSALAHLFLFLSAVAVIKRACCLRFAAYRAGLLKSKCGAGCKWKCKRTEPVAT